MNSNLDQQLENLRVKLEYLENMIIPELKVRIDNQSKEIDMLKDLIRRK